MIFSVDEPVLLLFALNATLVLITLLHMLYRRRSPQTLMAWLLTIILLPYLGVVIYFIFGLHKSLHHNNKSKIAMLDIFATEPKNLLAKQIGQTLRSNNIAGTTDYNQITILEQDYVTYNNLMQAIKNAQTHIHLETYIFELDVTGKAILNALIEKSKQGVEVKLLVDALGSFSLYLNPKPLKELSLAGGSYAFFHPFRALIANSQINLRNHRKIYLFDQKTLFTGGMNLTNDYLGLPLDENSRPRWVDLMFEVQGPNVVHYQNIFNADWFYATKEKLSPAPEPELFQQRDIMQVVPSGADIDSEAFLETLLLSIYSAKEHIQISTPYFIPNGTVMTALLIAIKRNVKITLLTPKKSDHLIFDLGRSSYMHELLEAGGEVRYYIGSMLHAKLIIFDSCSAMIGTANFDYRSLFINYEIVNFIYSEHLINQLLNWFEKHLKQSECYQPKDSKLSRIFENMTRTIAPIL